MDSQTSPPSVSRPRNSLLSAIVLVTLLLVCIFLFSIVASPAWRASTKLTCERVEVGAPVNCSIERTFLFLVPMGTERVSDLRRATVTEFVDQDGDLFHRVELATSQGVVPLTSVYIPGPGTYQADLAAKLNDFVLGDATGSVVFTDYFTSAMSALTPLGP